jgi:transposase
MKVLLGVDTHKASLAVAAIDEATGEILERASFPQDRAGLRGLERWARRFPERRWAVENAGGLGRHLAGRLAGSGESVVDVPPKLSARVRMLLSGNARKNDGVDALATALAASRNGRLAAVDPEDSSEAMRLLSERREDLVAERTRALNRLHGLLRDLLPGRGGQIALGRQGSAHPERHTPQGRFRPPTPAAGFGSTARRPYAGQEDRRPGRAHRS